MRGESDKGEDVSLCDCCFCREPSVFMYFCKAF